MTIESLAEAIKEKTEELSFGIGVEKSKLPDMDYTEHDIELLQGVEDKGEIKIEGNKFTASGLAAKVASELFLQYGDDEAEYIIEEEVDLKRIKSVSKMGSFHFMKLFDEDEWMCFKSFTDYDHKDMSAFIAEFTLEELVPETGRTDDLAELVRYIHSVDKDLTQNKGEHIKNQYSFQCGNFDGVSYR